MKQRADGGAGPPETESFFPRDGPTEATERLVAARDGGAAGGLTAPSPSALISHRVVFGQ